MHVHKPQWTLQSIMEKMNLKEQEEEKVEDNVVTLEDVDILDCPICCEHLCPPVYQCDLGHLACDSCCKNIRYSCPSCTKPIGFMRCRAMERVVESAKISCGNVKHGCKEKPLYSKKLKHEENECKYIPISCPLCDFAGVSQCLYIHFAEKHPSASKQISLNHVSQFYLEKNETQFILQERDEKILFVLNRVADPAHGSFLNVICVAQASSGMEFSYSLTEKGLPGSLFRGRTTVNITTTMEITPKFMGKSPKENGLLVIHHCTSTGCPNCHALYLELIIERD